MSLCSPGGSGSNGSAPAAPSSTLSALTAQFPSSLPGELPLQGTWGQVAGGGVLTSQEKFVTSQQVLEKLSGGCCQCVLSLLFPASGLRPQFSGGRTSLFTSIVIINFDQSLGDKKASRHFLLFFSPSLPSPSPIPSFLLPFLLSAFLSSFLHSLRQAT